MKNKIGGAVAVLLLVSGFLTLNYPALSTLYNQLRQDKVVRSYDNKMQSMDESEKQEYLKGAEAYNKKLAGEGQQLSDAFSEDDIQKAESEDAYNNVLNMEESGVMGSLEIPKISLYLPFYHGTSTEVLERGVGHLEGSSIPVGGESTHAVLTGHRGLPSAELFTNLDQIEKEDVFYIHILGDTLAYQVYSIETVEPDQTESLAIKEGQDLVTLVTCTPYGINTHRLFIHGRRIPYSEESDDQEEALKDNLIQWLLGQKVLLISTGILVLMLVLWLIQRIKKKRAKGKNIAKRKGGKYEQDRK